jgi:signal transduction histidine kinase
MKASSATVLLVDDDPAMLGLMKRVVEGMGFIARTCSSRAQALAAIRAEEFGAVVADVYMETADAGVHLAREARVLRPGVPVVLITGNPGLETAVTALRTRAFDYLPKPFALDDLRRIVRGALASRADAGPFREELREELSAAYFELKKVERTREGLLAILSHELNTPLCAAQAAAEEIEAEPCSADGEMARRLLKNGLDRLGRATAEIILHARLAGGLKPDRSEPVNLGELAAEAVAALGDEAAALGVRIELTSEPGRGFFVGDRDLLERAIRHLLTNAVRFNRAGGLVTVRTGGDDERADISVLDEGGGIPPAELARVFDPYYQVADFMTRRVGGLGLGLSIVREVFEGHGGEVLVLNHPNAGCEFRAWIPVRAVGAGRA